VKLFLVIVFVVGGEHNSLDGFGPLPMKDHESCVERKKNLDDYIKSVEHYPRLFTSSCVYAKTPEEATEILKSNGIQL